MTVIDAVEIILESRDDQVDECWNKHDIENWDRAFDKIMDCLGLMYCKEQDRIIIRQD